MATKENLIGLGVNHMLADRIGVTPVITSVGGSSAGSALRMGGTQYLTVITASNSGSGLRLPDVGASAGTSNDNFRALLGGPPFMITNNFGAAIQIYAANNDFGSAVTLVVRGSAIAGTTGVSLGVNQSGIFYPVTVSTWVGISASVA